jgi:alkanesulfonate monooxygenase SsuD/methylene tetrahydromethanopterin reductase-like flavin-dependent oxidoreductase (luciferase family)
MIAMLAATMTQRMRIGTAGVLLNFACPAKLAEEFRILELFFPGRIDLGVAGARLKDHEDVYLDGRPPPTAGSYAARLQTLVELVRGSHTMAVGPSCATRPPLWLCGSSQASAELAGRLGMHYGFHHYFSRSVHAARAAIATYRRAYRSTDGSAPYALIACYGACAETQHSAERQWAANAGAPCFVGSPAICVEQLRDHAEACDADEIAVHVVGIELEARLDGYALLAEAAGLIRNTIDNDQPVQYSMRLDVNRRR